jgi:hypothetical protein
MSNIAFGNIIGRLLSNGLQRFSPEPKSNMGTAFEAIASTVTTAASTMLPGIDAGSAALLSAQIEAQKQMQIVSMHSNVEKSKHETMMNPIRNTRVG